MHAYLCINPWTKKQIIIASRLSKFSFTNCRNIPTDAPKLETLLYPSAPPPPHPLLHRATRHEILLRF